MSEVDVVRGGVWLQEHLPGEVVQIDQRVVGGTPFVWVTVSDELGERGDRAFALRNIARRVLDSLARGSPGATAGAPSPVPVVRLRFVSEVAPPRGQVSVPADELVERRPDALGGQPVLRGTRIGFEQLLRLFRMGTTEAEVLASYPTLDRERVRQIKAHALTGSA